MQTKKYIAIHNDELKAKERERLRKKVEERELAEKVRRKVMLNNLETLRDKAKEIELSDDLIAFTEWLQRVYGPPESSVQDQLHQHIEMLKARSGSRRMCLKKIIRLYHPDKNSGKGDNWTEICAEITKVSWIRQRYTNRSYRL
jgi:hypothetical protein